MAEPPPLTEQAQFWDEWNREWRNGALDEFMQRQRNVAVDVVRAAPGSNVSVLEAGCGTGWLSHEMAPYASVVGVDLSSASIAFGSAQFTDVELVAGDFLTIDLRRRFDVVVSADAIAHMYDRRAYVARVVELLLPGGTFLLMTQNGFVWRRRSKYRSYGGGQVEVWPSLTQLKELLEPAFTIERISSLVPGGDRGVLFWVENRYIRGGMRRILGRERWDHFLERLRLGRELVLVCRRRDAGSGR